MTDERVVDEVTRAILDTDSTHWVLRHKSTGGEYTTCGRYTRPEAGTLEKGEWVLDRRANDA